MVVAWSNDPAVWLEQLGVVFSMLTTVFTGVYVWLTYRLMLWTAQTARIAFAETLRPRVERLESLTRIISSLGNTLRQLRDGGSSSAADVAALLTADRMAFRPFVESSEVWPGLVGAALVRCRGLVDNAVSLVNEEIGRQERRESEIVAAANDALDALQAARQAVENELQRVEHMVALTSFKRPHA